MFEPNEPVVISNGTDKFYARCTGQDGGKVMFATPCGSVVTMGFFYAASLARSIKNNPEELIELTKFEHTGD